MGILNSSLYTRLIANRPELLWLIAGICLAVIPHTIRIPIWMSVLFFSLVIWRLSISTDKFGNLNQSPTITALIKCIIAAVIFVGVLTSYRTLVGRDAGVALLILLAGMKILEIRQARDYYIASFIGLFLTLTNYFYTQSIIIAVYTFLVLIVFIAALISFNDRDNILNGKELSTTSASMLLQTIPFMLVLFLLFPRISGPLWGLPKDAHSGITGINDEMTPGSISQLTLSNEVAFRVEFSGNIPDKSSLYWRGPVLWLTDGVKWVRGKSGQEQTMIMFQGSPVNYTVTLEATNKNWLYGLDVPTAPPENSFFNHDLHIKTKKPVQSRRRYTLTSYTNYRISNTDQNMINQALQLPYGYHEKTINLARSWLETGLSKKEIIKKSLLKFNKEEYYYSLNPPLTQQDSIDEFLFDTREGFCGHFASAFVVLMRAAGIPARIVTGYQGGTLNSVGNYLVIRQRDAHAWAEVWLSEEGWVRVDPTFAVSPARIREGIESALPYSIIEIPLGLQDNIILRDLWRRFSDTFDAMNNRWNQWVLGYDNKKQNQLLEKIGLGGLDWQGLIISIIITIVCLLLAIHFWLFKHKTKHPDQAKALYDDFCDKMAKLGTMRNASEGPLDYANRAANCHQEQAQDIHNITKLYINIRYGGQIGAMELFKQYITTFKPKKLMYS